MTATIVGMNWFIIDTILVDTLEIGDHIEVDGTIVEIIDIEDDIDGIWLSWKDDFDNEYGDLFDPMMNINIYMELDRD